MEVIVGEVYHHFKGNDYVVRGIASSSDDPNQQYVVYEDLETQKLCVRRYEEFVEELPISKYPDVKQKFRFELVAEEE